MSDTLLVFTREDVMRLRNEAAVLQAKLTRQGTATWDFPQAEIDGIAGHIQWLESLADRIAALLPPEGK